MKLKSYAGGQWIEGRGNGSAIYNAVTGEQIGAVTSDGLDFKGMLEYARNVGGPKLRAMTFHERAMILKNMAKYLTEKKEDFYALSPATGATRTDSWIDIEGGIGTFFVFSSKARRELPNESFYVDGPMEGLSKTGSFVGRHICVPLEGVALHINAFNFPCWGMLEKIAPTWLAGMPAIIKPASATAYLTERMVQSMIASGIVPEGALQLICGGVGDIFEHLTCQDVVTFTGSASTGQKLKAHPNIVRNSIRFNMEADSLNCSILGPDALPGTDEFDLFIKEVAREMTVKAGQKCTAIRRTIVPDNAVQDVLKALGARLAGVTVGDPKLQDVRMGPLASRDQLKDVQARIADLRKAGELVYGDPSKFEVLGASAETGAFCPPTLLYCKDPFKFSQPHDIEAFGPVSTVMSYKSVDEAIELAKRGKGSLVGSLFTNDDSVARKVVLGSAALHGRIMILNRDCAKESTGHGSPMPHLIHGGPGRAGGGEEMGGMRAVMHYMQRSALQGSPSTLTKICDEWMKGAKVTKQDAHPFRRYFDELEIGEALVTATRTITEADVVNFAQLSGDKFYAHMDDNLARQGIFERRVAHGYFIVSAAAGLFVDPAFGPVLANYGMENLRFTKPVYIGDTIQVRLTCKRKIAKDTPPDGIPQGVVEWDVEVTNQDKEPVAIYTILTLVRRKCLPRDDA